MSRRWWLSDGDLTLTSGNVATAHSRATGTRVAPLVIEAMMQFQSLPLDGDPDRFAVVCAGRVIGRFTLHGLQAHGPAARLPGPHGIVRDLVIDGGLDDAALVLAAITHRSLARLYGSVFFAAGDRDVLRALGVAPTNVPNVPNVIGVFEPGRADNLARYAA